jgi:hypothetical protein
MQHVSSFCTRVMVMDHGQTLLDTPNPSEAIDCYFGLVRNEVQTSGTGGARVLELKLITDGRPLTGDEPKIAQGTTVSVSIRVRVDAPSIAAYLNLFIHDESMAPIVAIPVYGQDGEKLALAAGEHRLDLPLGRLDLNSGKYSFVVIVRDAADSVALVRMQGLRPFRVSANFVSWGKIVRPTVPSAAQMPASAVAWCQSCGPDSEKD